MNQAIIKNRPLNCQPQPQPQPLTNVPDILQNIYQSRGVNDAQQLDYSLSQLIPPSLMKSNLEAGRLLAEALMQQQSLLIVADFDVDGATSCTLMMLALRAMGAKHVSYLVPDRFKFGYGLTPEIVEVAAELSPDLIITVDNGIASIDGVERANQLGIKVLITDHHLPGAETPEAIAIVNPNQTGCEFPSKALAGVGVAFYLMMALRIQLRELKWFEQQRITEPNLSEYLDLVALGTVADIVPLDHNNRILVSHGLRRIRAGKGRVGINTILNLANKSFARIQSSDLGFAVGPRLNAAGRLDDMSLGIECLLSRDENQAMSFATELDRLNRERREIEASMQKQAMDVLSKLSLKGAQLDNGVCLYKEQWHQGIIGLLASRIKDKVFRPVIVFADADTSDTTNHCLKGSARSIPGLHIRDILDSIATQNPHLLSKFGGHAMAAGMTIQKQNLKEFSKAFNRAVTDAMKSIVNEKGILENILWSDGELQHQQINLDMARILRDAGPWGQGFDEPRFHGKFKVISQRVLSGKHLKLQLENSSGTSSGKTFDAIAFFQDDEILTCHLDRVSLLYKMDVNFFREQEKLQFLIDDLRVL